VYKILRFRNAMNKERSISDRTRREKYADAADAADRFLQMRFANGRK